MFDQLKQLPPEVVQEVFSSPLKWAQTFLVTPNTGKPFEANYVENLILSSERRYNVIRVHRRAGKSWALSTLALYHALTAKNSEILVICPDGSKVATIFDRIREFIQANPWISPHVDGDRQNLPQRISFKNGSKINGFTTAAKTKGEATGLRSQGADVILMDEAAYLGEGDWAAIQPIMTGDMYRRRKTKVYVASTPAYTRGHYYNLCKDTFLKQTWHEIHVRITENPSVTPELLEECKATCSNEMDWNKEYMAEFPELGEGVFPKTLVDRACRNFDYHVNLSVAMTSTLNREKPASRTIGVDWDKYNKDGHGSTIVVLESVGPGRYRLIYREEIQQSEFTLKNAVTRLIELNDIFQPEWIYIDKGYGEMQFEELQLFGKKFPKTGLLKKVVSVQFAESVECPLPGGGFEKKRFKQAMVSLLRTWFENQWVEIPHSDHHLRKDLIEYHVKGQTDSNIKYSDENDHSIAALGLAAMAMHHKVKNPYLSPPAVKSYSVPAPVSVSSDALRQYYGKDYRRNPLLGNRPEFDTGDTFSRRTLGDALPHDRSKF